MGLLPDEAKVLPPPGIVNRNSVWLGMCGFLTSMLDNTFKQRPALKSGLHRHVLMVSVGWFLGYHVSKIVNYKYANRDREMASYIQTHPDLFPEKEKKTFAEITEPFHAIR